MRNFFDGLQIPLETLDQGLTSLDRLLSQQGGSLGAGLADLAQNIGQWGQGSTRQANNLRQGVSRERNASQPTQRVDTGEPRSTSFAQPRQVSDQEKYRFMGNEEYTKGNYSRAIALYKISNDIEKNPLCYSNTAICLINLRDLEGAFAAIQEALALDMENPKFHRIKGVIFAEKAKLNRNEADALKAIASLEKAQARQPNEVNTLNLRRARALAYFLHLEVLGEAYKRVVAYFQPKLEASPTFRASFDKFVSLPTHATALPSFLTCPITLDLLQEPVQLPSGITYERVMLDEFWKTPACAEGRKDPISKELLAKDAVCAPNKLIEEHVKAYLVENPWAAEFSLAPCSDWTKLKFKI